MLSTKGKNIIHLKGLNGIRAIAVFTVVLSHTMMSIPLFGINKVMQGWDFANYGVTMFFTLSGFLITYLLIKEKESFNTISVPQFYVRRILRIWPLYYLYILLALLIYFKMKMPGGLIYYIFLGANIPYVMGTSIIMLAHYWSLGVEEQFYLFWPWLVKWFNPLRSIPVFLALFLILKGVLRMMNPASVYYQFIYITRFDCMAIGAFCAILLNSNKKQFISLSYNRVIQALCWVIILLAATGMLRIPDFLRHNVFSVATAIIIINVAFNERTLVNLDNKVLDFLGKISYGIYVYHSLLIYCLSLFMKQWMPANYNFSQLILVIFAVIVSTVFVSWLSYEFFEKKFLRFKNRFSKVFSRS